GQKPSGDDGGQVRQPGDPRAERQLVTRVLVHGADDLVAIQGAAVGDVQVVDDALVEHPPDDLLVLLYVEAAGEIVGPHPGADDEVGAHGSAHRAQDLEVET